MPYRIAGMKFVGMLDKALFRFDDVIEYDRHEKSPPRTLAISPHFPSCNPAAFDQASSRH
jgi:hypothetical protein